MMKLKLLITEILWLLAIALLCTLFCFLWFGNEIFRNEITINLHDTYFITQSLPVIFTLVITISFIAYLIKESKRGYTRKPQNIITLVFGLLLIVVFSKLMYVISSLNYNEALSRLANGNNLGNGWSVSPKLSAVKDINKESGVNFWQIATNIVLFFQVVIVLSLCKVCYKWGRN